MMNVLFLITFFISGLHFSQKIKFEEYDLPNGLHVILHQDNTVPVVTTGVMYHVGSKDEVRGRTGFAHFFEHLLFEGTPNIKRGEWFKVVASNGGDNNATTSNDITYYYETFPSNNEQLGLWMEAERMCNAVINQVGVDTQRDVVKEEKRVRFDGRPYGNLLISVYNHLFSRHPYSWVPIGSMEDLDSAKLEEFVEFYKKYYVPNNATLVVAGDIKPEQTKKWIEQYYGGIPRGTVFPKNYPKEEPIIHEKEITVIDSNIQIPAYVFAYRTPNGKERDSYILDMLLSYLSMGSSSVLYQKLVDQDRKARMVNVANTAHEDYGILALFIYPMGETEKASLQVDIDAEIKKLQTNLISQEDYEKLQNQFETQFVSKNTSLEEIAKALVSNYILKKNTGLINTEIEIYRSVTREDLQNAAKKYLNPNQRVIINYMPDKK
ncbi:peptidase M16 [Elizabethkingia anophelis]|nr:peptidase M16 [Elizabethkingia anophelis]